MRKLVAGLILAVSLGSLVACSSPSGAGFVPRPPQTPQGARVKPQDSGEPLLG